ncbi:MAG: DUF3570 domain-containing protein [Gammaproteobacteria bacterium]|nr:DUF3570 domain-containing protein [Gammaproteobacteria bacterium]
MSLWGGFLLLFSGATLAQLPEERSDLSYRYSQGDGMEMNAPGLLLRKHFADRYALSFAYQQEQISGLPDDLLASASPLQEQRDATDFAIDYQFSNSLMSLTYSRSEEADYQRNRFSLGVSHDLVGDRTVSLAFSRGVDQVLDVSDSAFEASAEHFNYKLGVAQLLNKDLRLSVNFESINDSGYLNNPYRRLQGINSGVELYPETRSSNIFAFGAKKAWSEGRSGRIDYRYRADTWQVAAQSVELGFSSKFQRDWLLDLYYRYYAQDQANFYQDSFEQNFNFMASDKVLSRYQSNTLGAKVSFDLASPRQWGLDKGSFNLAYELMEFDYDDYSDLDGNAYRFGANSLQLYLSVWY